MVAYALLSLVAIAHHPQVTTTVTDPAIFGKLAALGRPDEVMHGTMVGLLMLLGFSFVALSCARGFGRPAIIAASICAAVGIAFPIAAAAIDGFWIPWFASHVPPEPAQRAIGAQLIVAASIFVQIASKFGFVGIGSAVALYSLDFVLSRRSMLLGSYGFVAGIGVIVMLATISSRLTPHTLVYPMALQTIWIVTAGALLAHGQLTQSPD
jgi:hypothetical protein